MKPVDLETRADAIGLDLAIAGLPYDAGEIEETMPLLEESESLHPKVLTWKIEQERLVGIWL